MKNNQENQSNDTNEKLLLSSKMHKATIELNRQIEDAYKKGHPVYLEISATGGFPTVTPIFFPRGLYASGKEIG